MPPRVSEVVAATSRSGALDDAHAAGEARREGLLVRVGLWFASAGDPRVVRARWKATTCAALIAYAESACAALEAGTPPSALDAAAVRALVAGVHPIHHDRAALVAGAILHARERIRAGAAAGAPPGGGAA